PPARAVRGRARRLRAGGAHPRAPPNAAGGFLADLDGQLHPVVDGADQLVGPATGELVRPGLAVRLHARVEAGARTAALHDVVRRVTTPDELERRALADRDRRVVGRANEVVVADLDALRSGERGNGRGRGDDGDGQSRQKL